MGGLEVPEASTCRTMEPRERLGYRSRLRLGMDGHPQAGTPRGAELPMWSARL